MFRTALAATVAALLFALPSAKGDTTIDLTTAGNVGILNGAYYQQTSPQPTGTGFIDSFLRIDATGSEQGFNTNASPPPLDDKGGIFTHAITVGDLAIFTNPALSPTPSTNTDGSTPSTSTYYRFLLDINQTSSNNLLSLNSLQIYTGAGLANISTLPGSTPRYDMNATSTNDVTLNYALNPGSGGGDMYLYVPTSDFVGALSTDNVVLYAQFGNPPGQYASNDGFEEWAASTTTPGVPFGAPAPSTVALALSGLVCVGFVSLRRLRRPLATIV